MSASKFIAWVTAFFCLICSFVVLWVNLGDAQIRMWDEATYALNSLDMFQNGNYLLTSTDGVPDFYNSQPQLVIWAQTISLHLFGVSEFAIRFPSALAASFLLLFIFYFFKEKALVASLCVLILVSIPGYVSDHVTRTGDIDSMLILWMSIAVFSWYKYIVKDLKKWRLVFFIAFFLAIMTKGIAIFMMLPGVLLGGVLLNHKHRFYRDWKNYLLLGSIFFVLTIYYTLREKVAPGYLADVYQDSFGRFFGNAHQWDKHPWSYYLDQIWNRDFQLLRIFLPIIIFSLFINGKYSQLQYYLLIVAVLYLGIITLSSTKTYWYDAPLYPLLAASSGLATFTLVEYFANRFTKPVITLFGMLICLGILISTSVKNQYNRLNTSEIQTYNMELEGLFLRHLSKEQLIKKPYTILKDVRHPEEHFDQAKFYIIQNKFNLGIEGYTALKPSGINTDYVLVCQEKSKEALSKQLQIFDTLYSWKQGSLFLKIRRVERELPGDS